MSFLGTRAGPLADLALVISIVAFTILCLGVVYAKRGIFSRHFKMTRLAVILAVIAFLLWMGFSLIRSFQTIISHLTNLPILVTVFHAIIGASVLVAGTFLAIDRIIKKSRFPMRTVFIFWVLTMLLGITTYFMRYILFRSPPR